MRRLLPVMICVLVVAPLCAQPAGRSYKPGPPAQPWGTWYWLTDISAITGIPGTSLPTVIAFDEAGTFTCTEGNSFGGVPGAAFVYSAGVGAWVKTEGDVFKATRIGFVFDKATGVLKVIGRSRFTFEFAGDFEHATGTLFVETLPCGVPFACPDPLDPDAAWIPASPPNGFPTTARRLHAVPIAGEP